MEKLDFPIEIKVAKDDQSLLVREVGQSNGLSNNDTEFIIQNVL